MGLSAAAPVIQAPLPAEPIALVERIPSIGYNMDIVPGASRQPTDLPREYQTNPRAAEILTKSAL
jgi:hypothetical protein